MKTQRVALSIGLLIPLSSACSLLDDALVWNAERRKRGLGIVTALRGMRTP